MLEVIRSTFESECKSGEKEASTASLWRTQSNSHQAANSRLIHVPGPRVYALSWGPQNVINVSRRHAMSLRYVERAATS